MMDKKNNKPMSYVKTLGNAMGAWRDENKDKRAYIVLAMSENEDTAIDDSRCVQKPTCTLASCVRRNSSL